MLVKIFEIGTNKTIAVYPISLDGLNYIPADTEYFAQAWINAVDDDLVNSERRDKYFIEFLV